MAAQKRGRKMIKSEKPKVKARVESETKVEPSYAPVMVGPEKLKLKALVLPDPRMLPKGVRAMVECSPDGLRIAFESVPGQMTGPVAAYGMILMKNLRDHFEELGPILPDVGAGHMPFTEEDECDEDEMRARRMAELAAGEIMKRSQVEKPKKPIGFTGDV